MRPFSSMWMCTSVCLLIVGLLHSAVAGAPRVFDMEYAVGDSEWRRKATFTIDDFRAIKIDDAVTHWTYEEVKGLRAGRYYRLRILNATSQSVLAAAMFSPCVLLTPKQYANTPIRNTQERIAITLNSDNRPVGIQQAAHFTDTVCELSVFVPALRAAERAAGKVAPLPSDSTDIAHKFVITRAVPLETPADPPFLRAPVRESAAGGHAAEQPAEVDNRTFIEKYWVYILMFVGYQILTGLLDPRKAGPKNAQGAPAK